MVSLDAYLSYVCFFHFVITKNGEKNSSQSILDLQCSDSNRIQNRPFSKAGSNPFQISDSNPKLWSKLLDDPISYAYFVLTGNPSWAVKCHFWFALDVLFRSNLYLKTKIANVCLMTYKFTLAC